MHRPLFTNALKSVLLATVVTLAFVLLPRLALAENILVVDDQEDLLTEQEEARLKTDFATIVDYTNCAVVTTKKPSSTAERFALDYIREAFFNDTAVVFVIDLYTREITVTANRAGQRIVSDGTARQICDNVYTYAVDGDYFGCAYEALSEILSVAEGSRIARPMKHITSLLVALTFGILINFLIAYGSRSRLINRGASAEELARMAWLPSVKRLSFKLTKTEVVHKSQRSSGFGGFSGGGGGGGFSGGGGGFSGGGGGSHNF